MNNYKSAFLITAISGLSTLLGLLFIFFPKNGNKKTIYLALAFASGVMAGVSILDLIPESINFLNNEFLFFKSIIMVILFTLLGIVMAYFTGKYIPDNNSVKGDKTLFKLGFMSMLAIMMHNIPEGIVTFVATNAEVKLGIYLAIAIAMQNIPEGISIALPIYYGTKNKFLTFIYTFIASLSELLGALIAFIFLPPRINNLFMGIIFSVISGLMLQISLFELLPNALKEKNKILSLLFFVIGVIFIQIFIF